MKRIYWLDNWNGKAQGGVYRREFSLRMFIKKVEREIGKVVGIALDDDYNIEFITEKSFQKKKERGK